MRRKPTFTLMVCLTLLPACSQQTPPKKNPTSTREESSEPQSSGQSGNGSNKVGTADGDFGKTLTGKVLFNGDKAPERTKLVVDKDQAHCLSKGDLLSESMIVHPKNLGVKDVYVWLLPQNKGDKIPIHPTLKDVPPKKHEMDQPCCMFVPHALIMRAGDTLVAKNSSPIPHNFRWAGHPLTYAGNNVILQPGEKKEINDIPGGERFPIRINCDVHSWMKAGVAVFDHPYAALTDENGNFKIDLPPAGNYRLMYYHPDVGYLGGVAGANGYEVTIKGSAETDAGVRKIKSPG